MGGAAKRPYQLKPQKSQDSSPARRGRPKQQLFSVGSLVEVQTDEEDFKGVFFLATVIPSSPLSKNKSSKKNFKKLYVEYHNLLAHENGSECLREHVDASFVKPAPPPHHSSYTNVFDSIDTLAEEKELTGVGDKNKDSSDLLREWGCSESDISKIFARRPSLRKIDINILQSKLEILSNMGITSPDLVKMIHCRPRFLNCRINLWLNERLEYFEDLFGSREVLTKAIVRNPSLLTYDFHNKIKPVVALYESLGVRNQDLIAVLLSRPTLIPRTTLDDEKKDYIRRTGVSKESRMYKHVVSLFAISRIETIREKVMNLEKYGFSEEEIFSLVGRSPLILTLSVDKVQRNMTFILGMMKLSANMVLGNPFLLYFNLETALKPRFLLACKIEDMGIVPEIKGPAMLRSLRMSEKRFTSAFITCHSENVANELITFYNNAKSVRRLAESSKKNVNKGFPF